MKKIIFILLCLFFINVNADEEPIKIVPVCNGTYKVGSTFDVFFNVSGATESRFVGAIDGTFTYDKNAFSIESSSILLNGWSSLIGGVNENNKFMYGDMTFTNQLKTSASVVKMTFKANNLIENASFTISGTNATGPNEDQLPSSGGSCAVTVSNEEVPPTNEDNNGGTQNNDNKQENKEEEKQNPTTGTSIGISLAVLALMYFGIRFYLKRSKKYL